MRILVTGSSGTIGTRLCEKLLKDGHEVVGIDWMENKWQPSVQAITRLIDLRDEAALQAATIPSAIDVIVHLAANARVYELVEDPSRARDNVQTVFTMLEFARKHAIKKFIFASSREVYGNAKKDRYSEEMVHIEHCESPYTASKIAGEALVEAYTRCYSIDHIIFRFSNVYGMYDDSERVVPLFIRRARAGQPLTVFGKEKCLDFTYIDDTVQGIMQSIVKFEEAKNDTYNLAFGEGTTIVALAEQIQELVGTKVPVTIGKPRTGEVVQYIANIDKAKEKLGYDPKTSFGEGIKKAVEWYGEHT